MSEVITVVGLLFDLIGIGFLSLSGVLGDRPFRRWYYLRKMDKEELEEGKPGGAFQVSSMTEFPPEHEDSYDELSKKAKRQSLGVSFLVVGFGLQIIGTVL